MCEEQSSNPYLDRSHKMDPEEIYNVLFSWSLYVSKRRKPYPFDEVHFLKGLLEGIVRK